MLNFFIVIGIIANIVALFFYFKKKDIIKLIEEYIPISNLLTKIIPIARLQIEFIKKKIYPPDKIPILENEGSSIQNDELNKTEALQDKNKDTETTPFIKEKKKQSSEDIDYNYMEGIIKKVEENKYNYNIIRPPTALHYIKTLQESIRVDSE